MSEHIQRCRRVRLVIARFVLTLSVEWRNKKQLNKAVKLDGDKLKNSNEIRAYRASETQTLNNYDKNQNKEKISTWSKIKKSVTKAAENLRMKSKGKNNSWFNKECQKAVDKRQVTRQIMLQDPNRNNIDNYTRARTLANKIIRQQKRLSEKKALEEMETYRMNPRMFFKKMQILH